MTLTEWKKTVGTKRLIDALDDQITNLENMVVAAGSLVIPVWFQAQIDRLIAESPLDLGEIKDSIAEHIQAAIQSHNLGISAHLAELKKARKALEPEPPPYPGGPLKQPAVVVKNILGEVLNGR